MVSTAPSTRLSQKPNWLDLPQDIFDLIVKKLHFADRIRALAACKTWRDSEDHVKCSHPLPWVMSYPRVATFNDDTGVHSFTCEFFDPYSGSVHKVSDSIQEQLTASSSDTLFPIKLHDDYARAKLAIRNNSVLRMLDSDHYSNLAMLVSRIHSHGRLCSMLYLEEDIYYLFQNGIMRTPTPDVEKKTLAFVNSRFREPFDSCENMWDCWLIEIKGDLMMMRLDVEDETYKWMIFRFDWSEESWVSENSVKGCAIYISGNVAFSGPLKNSLEDGKLFYIDDGVFRCYSLSEEAMGTEIQCEEFSRIIRPDEQCELSFIEPSLHFSNNQYLDAVP